MLHLVALMAPIKPDVNICHISGCRLRLESQFLPDKSVGGRLHLQGNKSLCVSHISCVYLRCLYLYVTSWQYPNHHLAGQSSLSLSYLLICKELIKRKLNISPSRPLRRVSRAWAARPQWQCGDLRGSWRGGRCSGAVQGRLYTSCVRPLLCPGYRHSSGSSRWIYRVQSTE